ncbi:maleylpyruvate isomerase N-terminal domain-containing protein [uncultured Roseobacter sp.]|uniref:maleylpyruvate isomerase N-terminal domain-containing protein n=1 Tax=uncultured Roseobacter sp. TaxID=114847 RepID=UPI00261390DB|nr:maleylpyruvate isomerase N-terminal domain-containing protein [uncultured Roseobacter sp.]
MNDVARAALIARQGRGARYDAANAPARELAWARGGTAYFLRLLNGLSDSALDVRAVGSARSRRMIIAETGYHARRFADVIHAVIQAPGAGRLGIGISPDQAEVALGCTLPPRALRHLIEHTCVHLNVAWRDMKDEDWGRTCRDRDGVAIALRDLPRSRAQILWNNALDLRAGGRRIDAPPDLFDLAV